MPLCAFRVRSAVFCLFTLSSCAQEVTAVPDAPVPPPINAIVSKEKPLSVAAFNLLFGRRSPVVADQRQTILHLLKRRQHGPPSPR